MRRFVSAALIGMFWIKFASAQEGVIKYVRYVHEGRTSNGILDGETIRELDGDLFASPHPTGKTVPVSDVRLLPPCEPSKIIAVGLNIYFFNEFEGVADSNGLISLTTGIKCKSAKKENYGTCQTNGFHIRMRQIVVNQLKSKNRTRVSSLRD